MAGIKPVFLDVDSSIVENNLRITSQSDDELDKLFGTKQREYPSKLVKPHPGLCIKSQEVGTDLKVFVNICTTDAIPSPKDITETELQEIINSDDAATFRVPMSIGDVRFEKDKHGVEAKAVDIAIHPKFLQKIQTYQTFKDFLMALVFQALLDKHGLACVDKKIILVNRKAFGTLQVHRIQQREIDEKMGKEKPTLMQELTGDTGDGKSVMIETISSVDNTVREPEYRLYKKKTGPNCLFGEFKFPDVVDASDITLDVGEDRIVLEARLQGYFLDIFVPCCVRAEKTTSSFDRVFKILTVQLPLIGG